MDETGRVTSISNDPGQQSNCFLESFIINPELLLNITVWYDALGYMDLMDIFSENLDKFKVRGDAFDGYVGAVNGDVSYMKTNMELMDENIRNELFRSERPITTKVQDAAPAKYMASASVRNSLVSTGCIIEGTVENSILFRGAVVKKGAVIKNSIMMQKSVVGENSLIENVICDKYTNVKDGVRLYGSKEKPITVGKKREV